jgi:thiol-disulfide isomerase/thioredoxin
MGRSIHFPGEFIMLRPNRVLCGIVLGLAVLVGCAKKPKNNTDSANASGQQAQPAPNPVPPDPGQPGAPPGPPPSRSTTVFTADGEQPFPGAVAPTPPVAAGPTAPAGTGGPVDLVQCRFDKVEAALTAAKGKVVLVDCWAVWCPPCVATFPKLVEKHQKYKDKGLVCLSVSLDAGRNTPDKVHAFLKERSATFQNFYLTDLRADDAKMDARFGKVEFIPHAVVFNKKGEKIWQGNPGPNEAKLTAMVEAELAK